MEMNDKKEDAVRTLDPTKQTIAQMPSSHHAHAQLLNYQSFNSPSVLPVSSSRRFSTIGATNVWATSQK